MENNKIIFFDIDNTLYGHRERKGFSPLVFKTIDALKAKGYKLVVCTSRSFNDLKHLDKAFLDRFDCKLTMAGTCIVRGEQKEYFTIDYDELQEALAYLDARNITYRYCVNDGNDYLNQNDEPVEQLFYRLYQEIPPIKKYAGEQVNHMNLYFGNDEKVLKDLREIFKNAIIHDMGKITSEVSPKGVDKGEQMLRVAKEYGFEKKDIIAFGDGDNDITMIKLAGLGIAMGSGTKRCLEAADYIAPSVEEDGVYKACLHFGLIEEIE